MHLGDVGMSEPVSDVADIDLGLGARPVVFGRVPERALVLAPHTDDAELGVGGTIARLCASGCDVHIVNFSAAEESVPSQLDRQINREDALLASSELGVNSKNVETLDFRVRRFPANRQEILDVLVSLRQRIAPDIVFAPSAGDRHQDHATVRAEAERAFGRSTLLGYELPWNDRVFEASVHIALSESEVERKCAAVARYTSQTGRDYTNPKRIRAWVDFRGVQAGMRFAEAFDVYHWRID